MAYRRVGRFPDEGPCPAVLPLGYGAQAMESRDAERHSRRLGLVCGGTNTIALGRVLGAFAEVIDGPLVVLNHFWLRSLFNQFARKIISD